MQKAYDRMPFAYLHEGASICMGDCDTKAMLARSLNSQYVEVTPLKKE